MRKLFLFITVLFSFNTNAQDATGAISGAISTTLHNNSSTKEVPSKKVYILIEDIKVENTFIVYRDIEYQVYKTSDNRYYFIFKKKRRFFTINTK